MIEFVCSVALVAGTIYARLRRACHAADSVTVRIASNVGDPIGIRTAIRVPFVFGTWPHSRAAVRGWACSVMRHDPS
jgi:hypothetical protein